MGKTTFFLAAAEIMYGASLYDDEFTIKLKKERRGHMKNKVKLVIDKSNLLCGLSPDLAYYYGVLTFYLFGIPYGEKRKTLLTIIQRYLFHWEHDDLTPPLRDFEKSLAL